MLEKAKLVSIVSLVSADCLYKMVKKDGKNDPTQFNKSKLFTGLKYKNGKQVKKSDIPCPEECPLSDDECFGCYHPKLTAEYNYFTINQWFKDNVRNSEKYVTRQTKLENGTIVQSENKLVCCCQPCYDESLTNRCVVPPKIINTEEKCGDNKWLNLDQGDPLFKHCWTNYCHNRPNDFVIYNPDLELKPCQMDQWNENPELEYYTLIVIIVGIVLVGFLIGYKQLKIHVMQVFGLNSYINYIFFNTLAPKGLFWAMKIKIVKIDEMFLGQKL